MIKSVEVVNFLSHGETRLDFEKGVTVFVGHNGAGKSSIIDAITFALFAKHTRKSNKGLIKRGESQAYAKVRFELGNKKYVAERKIDSRGNVSAKFSEEIDGNLNPIAAGERKQFGESMTEQIEDRIGLNFDKLKIASIVQQGELNSIINAKPKEFKELLNAIIGIDKLDVSSEIMKLAQKKFRESIRERIGYDDSDIDIVKKDLENCKTILNESLPKKTELLHKKQMLETHLDQMKSKLELDTPKVEKLNQLESRKSELKLYAKDAIEKIKQDITQSEHKIRECEPCFESLDNASEFKKRLQMVEDEIHLCQNTLQKLSNNKSSLNEKLSLAVKLQLKDGRCPVCDSSVDRLNPLFQEAHIQEEIKKTENEMQETKTKSDDLNQKRVQFSEIIQKAEKAEIILHAHAINNKNDIVQLKNEIHQKKLNLEKIPNIASSSLVEISLLDSYARKLFDVISTLENETRGFSKSEFASLKEAINQKQGELSETDKLLGSIDEKINASEEKIKTLSSTLTELDTMRKYIERLDTIQQSVFNRDGPVATSLRSWALNAISNNASDYLTLLNTKIQRIWLGEKLREISMKCYSKNDVLDLESLSGGEQVSVALALRLGMASLLGSSNLGLMILDEPTTHLDAERRKALVGVLSQLTNINVQKMPMQFIIITHDSEVFNDSTVEQIYKFESANSGTVVSSL